MQQSGAWERPWDSGDGLWDKKRRRGGVGACRLCWEAVSGAPEMGFRVDSDSAQERSVVPAALHPPSPLSRISPSEIIFNLKEEETLKELFHI